MTTIRTGEKEGARQSEQTGWRFHGFTLIGIQVGMGARISDCTVAGNRSDGIRIWDSRFPPLAISPDGTVVVNSTAYRNQGIGIRISSGSGHRLEANNVIGNAVGIAAYRSGNIVVKNSAQGNTEANYDIVEGNEVGPIGSMVEVGTHPWANFSIPAAPPGNLTSEENE